MNKRDFIKGLITVGAVSALPASALAIQKTIVNNDVDYTGCKFLNVKIPKVLDDLHGELYNNLKLDYLIDSDIIVMHNNFGTYYRAIVKEEDIEKFKFHVNKTVHRYLDKYIDRMS